MQGFGVLGFWEEIPRMNTILLKVNLGLDYWDV